MTRPQRELNLTWALVLISHRAADGRARRTIANIALPYIQTDLRHQPGQPALDRHRLRPDVRQPAAPRWTARRPLRPPHGLHDRPRHLRGRLAPRWIRDRTSRCSSPLVACQGLGAALASPAALALITTTFPAGPARNRAFAVYAAMSGAGAAVGLILGGWLTGTSTEIFGIVIDGWRLTFLINVPIGLAAAFLAPRFLNESESHPGELDLPGAVTGTLGLLGVVYGLSRAGNRGLGRHHHRRQPRGRRRAAARLRPHREPRRAPAPAVPDLHQPDPRRELRGDVPRPGGDVRDVLLPQPVHPERHGLQPRSRPASRSCRSRSASSSVPGWPPTWSTAIEPTLRRRRRHPDRGRRPVRLLDAPLRHVIPAVRRHGQLPHRHLAVHHHDGLRHGPHVRARHARRPSTTSARRSPASGRACSTPRSRSAALSVSHVLATVATQTFTDRSKEFAAAAAARPAALPRADGGVPADRGAADLHGGRRRTPSSSARS